MDKKIAEIKLLVDSSEGELEAMLKEPGLSAEKKRLIESQLESIQTTTRRKAETCKTSTNGGTGDGRK